MLLDAELKLFAEEGLCGLLLLGVSTITDGDLEEEVTTVGKP